MEVRRVKSCCVTGHRDIPTEKIAYIETELRREILCAISDGYRVFVSGFSKGTDMIFARLVSEIRAVRSDIMLEAALPYPTWYSTRSDEDKRLLEKCAHVGVHSEKYSPNCFIVRNNYMLNSCERLIAVYDGREKGGTVNTMRYAAALGREMRVIGI
jgi:uncharacterized phage-like protein YoqJ